MLVTRAGEASPSAHVQMSPIRVGSSIMNTWRPATVLQDVGTIA